METDGGKYPPLRTSLEVPRNVGVDTHFFHLAIPGRYPMTPPQEQEAVDAYYVVDCGREVGIFTDKYVDFTSNPIRLTLS